MFFKNKTHKATEEVKDPLGLITKGEEILENQNIALVGIDAPNRDTISNFLADVIEL